MHKQGGKVILLNHGTVGEKFYNNLYKNFLQSKYPDQWLNDTYNIVPSKWNT